MRKMNAAGLALLLAALWAAAPVKAEAAEGMEKQIIQLTEEPEEEAISHLTAGVSTPLSGYFFTNLWGRGTSDQDVRMLLHSYDLIRWNGEAGCFEADPAAVRGLTETTTAEGDKGFIFTLADDMKYSDGTPVTAWDYAFTILFETSPVIGKLGGVPADRSSIAGCTEYLNGEADVLSGVRVLADDMLMIVLDHEALPHFFEMGMLSCIPYPAHVIAPGVEIKDDGDGIYLAGEGAFREEALRGTILDPDTGYMSHPSVVSGPYRMVSWDGETAELARNEYYKDYQGYILQYPDGTEKDVPYIENLTVRYVPDAEVVSGLASGEIDVMSKVTRADTIGKAMELTHGTEDGSRGISMQNYPRTGLGYISFVCEREELTLRVRQAMAYCMDRDAIVQEISGGMGSRVDSFYGVGQWMYSLVQGTASAPVDPPEDAADVNAQEAYERELEEWASLSLKSLNPYGVNLREAEALLESEGWTVNAETGIREKEGAEGEMLTLDLTAAYPSENSAIAAALEAHWIPWLEEAGIQVTLVPMEFGNLIPLYYGWEDRGEAGIDMFFLASNFDVLFDPLVYFDSSEGDQAATWRYTRLEDPELARLAEDMRKTQPGAMLEYMKKWIAFEERFNEILPVLPIYSNVYFDFYTSDLHDYAAADHISWSSRIVDAKLYPAASVSAQNGTGQ